jgi:hypothetical protein
MGEVDSLSRLPPCATALLRANRGDISEMKTDLVEIKQRLGLIEA